MAAAVFLTSLPLPLPSPLNKALLCGGPVVEEGSQMKHSTAICC